MNKQKYVCFFCGESIEEDNSKIISLLAVLNWDKASEEQQAQQFFCHAECLKLKANKKIPLYLLDLID